jgi:YidC/Oxa1 family membrane protein insertase
MGVWDAVREGLGAVLAFFYSLVPNAGVAIILLTVAVRLLLFPLTAKQAKSMLAMQRVQPEIKKLQAKHKNDRQKLNEEMMKFYKENEINPLGGCLPLLLQMPVFIALYQTLMEPQKFIPTSSQMFHDICGGASASACKAPKMSFAGMDLTETTAKAVSQGLADAIPYVILLAIVVGAGFLQQRQTMRNQTTVNPTMKIVGRIMPVMFGFFAWNMPAGVALYFATSSLWQIGQQEVVFRTIGTAAGPPPKKARAAKAELEGKGGAKGSGKGAVAVEDAPAKQAGTKPGGAGKTGQGSESRAKGGPAKPSQGKGGQGGARAKPSGGASKQGQAGRAGGARSNRKRKR